MQELNVSQMRTDYRAMESGDTRMRAIRLAIAAAEQVNDDEAALLFHHDLIKESVFSGDRYQALVDFPQYLAITHRNQELGEANISDTLWMFKWIVEAASEFYQIERKQVLEWFSEFRRELTKNGYSLRTWYEKRAIFFSFCDRAKMRMDYDDFLSAPKDALSDGEACDLNSMVRFELEIGHREKAMEAAQKIFDRGFRTEEIPCKTYHYLITDAIRRGDMETADKYAPQLRTICSGQRFQLEPIGLMLCYDALTDPARGLQFYQQNLHLREGSRNPYLCFWFDRGAAKLIRAAAEAGIALPAGMTPAHADELLAGCRDIAAKFDARNRSDFFSEALI